MFPQKNICILLIALYVWTTTLSREFGDRYITQHYRFRRDGASVGDDGMDDR